MAPLGSPLLSPEPGNSSPATVPKGAISISKSKSMPVLNLDHPNLVTYANVPVDHHDEQKKLKAAFQSLSSRVDRLLASEKDTTGSLVLQACSLSLRTRMPLVLRQTSELIESAGRESQLVSKIRTTLAMVRAIQYMDCLQEGMDPETNEGIDAQLLSVLSGLDVDSLPEDFKNNLSFRVSPWVPSDLAFDLPLGESARTHLEGDGSSKLPISVEVEPVVEFRAHDFASVKNARAAARACKVTIEKCTHCALEFPGAGICGEATIQVRVTPLDGTNPNEIQVWGLDKDVQGLCIKEARA